MNLWLLREYKILMRRRNQQSKSEKQQLRQFHRPQMPQDYDSLLKRLSFEQPDYESNSSEGDFMSNMILKRNVTPYMASYHGNFGMVDSDLYGNSLKPSLVF
jgi:hypothetical protein